MLFLLASRRTLCIMMVSGDGLPHSVPIDDALCAPSQASTFQGPAHRHKARGSFWPCPQAQGRSLPSGQGRGDHVHRYRAGGRMASIIRCKPAAHLDQTHVCVKATLKPPPPPPHHPHTHSPTHPPTHPPLPSKEKTFFTAVYPELVGSPTVEPSSWSWLWIWACRWSAETRGSLSQLARAGARSELPLMRRRAEQGWRMRRGGERGMLACAAAKACGLLAFAPT